MAGPDHAPPIAPELRARIDADQERARERVSTVVDDGATFADGFRVRDRDAAPATDSLVGAWRMLKTLSEPWPVRVVEFDQTRNTWQALIQSVEGSRYWWATEAVVNAKPATPREVLNAKLATLTPEQRARLVVNADDRVGYVCVYKHGAPIYVHGHNSEPPSVDAMIDAIDAALAKATPAREPEESAHCLTHGVGMERVGVGKWQCYACDAETPAQAVEAATTVFDKSPLAAALIAAHDRADHRKAAANYAEYVTCQHGREPGAPCVPCSWAARIVELERENAALRDVVDVLTDCSVSPRGPDDRARLRLKSLLDAWKAGSHE